MKSFRDEAGQTLVLTALLMCALMGFMALAIDTGVAFRTERRLQTQADAAAIAAALCGTYGGNFCTQFSGTTVTTVASGAAVANGMSNSATVNASCSSSTSTCMSVHASPSYGQHTNSGYYEVIITQPSLSIFAGTFASLFQANTSNYSPLTVGARAVAGRVPGQTCLYVLNATADHALDVKGGAGGSKGAGYTIYAPACSIQVNSNAGDALCATGNGSIDSQQILVVGGQNKAGKCNSPQNNVQTGVAAANNPFSSMTDPNLGCTSTYGWGGGVTDTLSEASGVLTLTNTSTNATKTISESSLNPYTPVTGGASVNEACFEDSINLTSSLGSTSNNNLMWVFQNGLNIAGSGQVIISGTVDIPAGTLQEGNTNLFINGPTLDASLQPYTGMALMVTSTANGCGSSTSSFGSIPSGDGCVQLQFGSGGSPNFSCTTTQQASGQCNCNVTSGQPGITGTIYTPNDVLFMQDSGSCMSATNVIADELWSNSSLAIYNYNLAYTTSPLDVVRLVE